MDISSEIKPFPVVGVGASAGGLEALTHLLQHLPPDTGMAFVLVQHLDPDHPSALTELLARTTSRPVREVTDNLKVQPNHVDVTCRLLKDWWLGCNRFASLAGTSSTGANRGNREANSVP